MSYICTMYVPWFGDLPFYARTFIACCGKSPNIKWIVHSDQTWESELPKNIVWVHIDNPSKLIQQLFPTAPTRKWKHKLCDLKPFWHTIFNTGSNTEFVGWCDWDVVHNLSKLQFNFNSAKFTSSSLASPLFIQRADSILYMSPRYLDTILNNAQTAAWDESTYLKHTQSSILQLGLTPEVDLTKKAPYAVHMYKAKHYPEMYYKWITQYCDFEVG